jgi:hypothetical protein
MMGQEKINQNPTGQGSVAGASGEGEPNLAQELQLTTMKLKFSSARMLSEFMLKEHEPGGVIIWKVRGIPVKGKQYVDWTENVIIFTLPQKKKQEFIDYLKAHPEWGEKVLRCKVIE